MALNRSFGFLFLLAAPACSDPLPEPPDTSELELAYASPTASIEATDATQLGPVFDMVTEIYDILGEEDVFTAGSVDAAEEEDPETGETGADRFDLMGRGFLRVTHICPGWSSDVERTRETTGAIETTVRFDSLGLDGVYWGLADQCKVMAEEVEVRLDGDLILVRYGTGAIVRLDGLVVVDGEDFVDGVIDYAITAEGLEYRHELGNRGHVVIMLGADGVIQVRAANGLFDCQSSCEPAASAAALGGVR